MSDPMTHKVFGVTKQLQRKLGSHFLQTRLLDNLTEDVIDDENNYLPSEDIFLGLVARNLLQKKVEDGDLSVGQHDKFIKATIAFYRESLWYTLLNIMLTPVSGRAHNGLISILARMPNGLTLSILWRNTKVFSNMMITKWISCLKNLLISNL